MKLGKSNIFTYRLSSLLLVVTLVCVSTAILRRPTQPAEVSRVLANSPSLTENGETDLPAALSLFFGGEAPEISDYFKDDANNENVYMGIDINSNYRLYFFLKNRMVVVHAEVQAWNEETHQWRLIPCKTRSTWPTWIDSKTNKWLRDASSRMMDCF